MDSITDQIGEQLRQAREKAGLTREDVVFQTRLPRSAIEALENEDFSSFVSPVYAKSFLAQYSQFLNVDANPWLDALNPSNFIEGDPLLPLFDSGRGNQDDRSLKSESNGSWMGAVWLLLFSGVLVFGAIQVFNFFDLRHSQDNLESKKAAPPKFPQTIEAAASSLPAPPVAIPVTEDDEQALVNEQAPQPAPRAIIVR